MHEFVIYEDIGAQSPCSLGWCVLFKKYVHIESMPSVSILPSIHIAI